MVSARDGGDGMAGTWGDDVTWLFPSDRRIAGAKITDTMASARSNAATMKIARASGESALRVLTLELRMVPLAFPSRVGGVGLANCFGVKIN